MEPLTRGEIVAEIRRATRNGESVDSYALSDRLCRTDAIGRLSKSDAAYFDKVVAQLIADGDLINSGPFIASAKVRR